MASNEIPSIEEIINTAAVSIKEKEARSFS